MNRIHARRLPVSAPDVRSRACPSILAAAVAVALLAALPGAEAQKRGKGTSDKVYCWVLNGRKACGSTVPPEAANAERTVIDAKTGATIERIERVLTPEERAVAEVERRAQARAEREAEASRRRDLAMAMTYNTEADLMRAYDERTRAAEDGLNSSRIGEKTIRTALVNLLDQANNLQLGGKQPGESLLQRIREQHALLERQLDVIDDQTAHRAALDAERVDALERYRAQKQGALTRHDG